LFKDNEQNGSDRSNGGNGDQEKIVGGSVAGGVGLIGAASLIGIAGYKSYKSKLIHYAMPYLPFFYQSKYSFASVCYSGELLRLS
jgi:hypothetical protein